MIKYSITRKIMTVISRLAGLNDPKVASREEFGHLSYLRKLGNLNYNWTIYDIGAFKGTFSRSCLRFLKINKVVLIEPNPQLTNYLIEQFPDAEVLPIAIFDSPSAYYYLHGINPGQNYVEERFSSGAKEVESITLDKLLELYECYSDTNTKVFVKLDIEGSEPRVLDLCRENTIQKVDMFSIEVTRETYRSFTPNLILSKFPTFAAFRETRFGLFQINLDNPHWIDSLNVFHNLILINKKTITNWEHLL